MRLVTIARYASGVHGTFGRLTADPSETNPDGLTLFSGELPWRNNLPNVSCIPSGFYDVVWALSPAHGWCYHVIKVPERTDVEIHKANFCGDVSRGFRSDLKGCITLGTAVGPMNGQTAVLSSWQAFRLFYADLKQEDFRLQIGPS